MKFNIAELKKLYDNNTNIMKHLRSQTQADSNSITSILISYDLQAGSYIEMVEKNKDYTLKFSLGIAKIIDSLKLKNFSMLEVGVGESTTLTHVVSQLSSLPLKVFGIDISWSRVKYGQSYFTKYNNEVSCNLAVGDIFNMPFADSSIDIIYSSHSLEPNGGREEEALRELYRVAKSFIVLLEPSYENADENGKKRMKDNGYVMYLAEHAKKLGYKVVDQYPYHMYSNKNNPTEVIIIQKDEPSEISKVKSSFSCPISRKSLTSFDGGYFCKESLLAYPMIMGVPCLTPEHAILTSKLDSFLGDNE